MEKELGKGLKTVKLGTTQHLPFQNYEGCPGALLCLCPVNSSCFIIFLSDAFSVNQVKTTTTKNKI